MQLIQNILSANQILTASLLSWFVAQVLKTIINFILLGKFQLERMWGDGGMPSAHSATVCAMAIVTGRSAGVSSPIFAVACVVAIITMHDAAGRGRRAARLAGGLFVPSCVMKCGLLQKLLCICDRAAQNGCGRKSERTNA